MKPQLRYRRFDCTRCNVLFEAKTDGSWAPPCIKCSDSEYVVNELGVILEEKPKEAPVEAKKEEANDPAGELITWPYL